MDEAHLAAALRYVSLNPMRARLVEGEQDWRLSSTRAHLRRKDDGNYAITVTVITVTALDCTPQVRHDNFCDRHFEDDLWQQEGRTVSFRRLTN